MKSKLKKIQEGLQGEKLLLAAKYFSAEQINELLSLGIGLIGENRVQEAGRKFPELKLPCEKHMIGHLQTNKVRQALELFDMIESVDSLKLAKKIDNEAEKMGKIMPIFLEVNIAGEEQKYGFKLDELKNSLEEIQKLSHLEVRGIMVMTPFTEDPESSRAYFREAKKLADKFNLPELSMGTSQDFQVAVEEGATIVRLGRSLVS